MLQRRIACLPAARAVRPDTVPGWDSMALTYHVIGKAHRLPAGGRGVRPYRSEISISIPPRRSATRMEAFQYPINTLFTIGYEDLGEVAGISVEVREMKDARGGRVRGVMKVARVRT